VVVAGAHRFLLAALEQLLPHRHDDDDEQRHAANEASSHSVSGTRTTTE